MEVKQCYLIGAMSNLTFEEYTHWRNKFSNDMYNRRKENDWSCKLKVISPPDLFNFEDELHQTELEVMQFELNAVRESNFVVSNLNFNNSTGSNIEMYEAYRNDIPVLAIWDKEKYPQHPWVEQFITRQFDTMDELMDYIQFYYLQENVI